MNSWPETEFFANWQPAKSYKRLALAIAGFLSLFSSVEAQEKPSEVLKETAVAALPPATAPQPSLGKPVRLRIKDAVALTLEKNLNISVSKEQMIMTRGQLQEASGAFDPVIQGQVTGSYTTTDNRETVDYSSVARKLDHEVNSKTYLSQLQDDVSAQGSIQTTLRNGIIVAPQFTYSEDLNDDGPATTDTSSGFVGFTVEIPLLQGLGPNNMSAAVERALRVEVASARSNLEYTISQQIYNTITSYWNCVLAQTNVRIARSNEDSAKRLVGITEALIKGYVEPSIQIAQARANLEQYSAQRIAAEQQQATASQQLAVAMGFTPAELLNEPFAIDSFPEPSAGDPLAAVDIQALIQLAMERRADVRSGKQMVASNQFLVAGAKNSTLPQINLQLGGGYQRGSTIQSQRGASTSRDKQHGAAVNAALSIAWPLFNNTAEGNLVQSESQLKQTELQVSLTETQVASDVITAAKSVILMRASLEEAVASAKNAEISVTSQEKLFGMGMSSLVEVITTQTTLASAQLSVATTQSNYATAVAGLRFATGTLLTVPDAKGEYSVNMKDLISIPRAIRPKKAAAK